MKTKLIEFIFTITVVPVSLRTKMILEMPTFSDWKRFNKNALGVPQRLADLQTVVNSECGIDPRIEAC